MEYLARIWKYMKAPTENSKCDESGKCTSYRKFQTILMTIVVFFYGSTLVGVATYWQLFVKMHLTPKEQSQDNDFDIVQLD